MSKCSRGAQESLLPYAHAAAYGEELGWDLLLLFKWVFLTKLGHVRSFYGSCAIIVSRVNLTVSSQPPTPLLLPPPYWGTSFVKNWILKEFDNGKLLNWVTFWGTNLILGYTFFRSIISCDPSVTWSNYCAISPNYCAICYLLFLARNFYQESFIFKKWFIIRIYSLLIVAC